MFGITESQLLTYLTYMMMGSGVWLFCLLTLTKFKIPYGRYYTTMFFDASVSAKTFWYGHIGLMAIAIGCWVFRDNVNRPLSWTQILLMIMFIGHYFHRALIFPNLVAGPGSQVAIEAFVSAFIFSMNTGYLQARYHMDYASYDDSEHLTKPLTLVGIAMFFVGMTINMHSDRLLRQLRDPAKGDQSGKTYKIPRGFLFEFVSAPNYFGELLEWTGWACVAQSPTAWAFAFMTLCNVGPRAWRHHQWYMAKFKDDYPQFRKALLPGVF